MTQMEQFIRQYAASKGLNPDIVMRTVLSEGGASSLEPSGYTRQSLVMGRGGQEQSYGPFQMYMGKGALGDRALAAGADPRNPADAFKVAQFAIDTMAKEGLGAWHGWKGSPWAAHGGKPSGETVVVPEGDTASGSYDPRRDTPSPGRPTGVDVDRYAQAHPVGPEGDDVTTSPYAVPGSPYTLPTPAGTEDAPLIVKEKTKHPIQDFGAAVAKLGPKYDSSPLANVQNAPNPPMTTLPASPTIDPASGANQRNKMVAALMALNSGKLWPGAPGGGQIG